MFYKYDPNKLQFVKTKLAHKIALGTVIVVSLISFSAGRLLRIKALDELERELLVPLKLRYGLKFIPAGMNVGPLCTLGVPVSGWTVKLPVTPAPENSCHWVTVVPVVVTPLSLFTHILLFAEIPPGDCANKIWIHNTNAKSNMYCFLSNCLLDKIKAFLKITNFL